MGVGVGKGVAVGEAAAVGKTVGTAVGTIAAVGVGVGGASYCFPIIKSSFSSIHTPPKISTADTQ